MGSALTGLRVLELGGEIAAPYATKLLADLGADVVKVEPPHGDPLRRWSPFPDDVDRVGVLFGALNGGKRSARVDLSDPEGAAWLQDALGGADLVVESLGAGALEAIGVDTFASDGRRVPLAVVRISDVGQEGPYVGRPSSPLVLQALGGWVSSHGVPEMSPVQVGARLHEYAAGSFAAAAALAAWRAARLGPEPVVVDLSLIECLVGTLAYPNLVMEDMLAAGLPPPMARHFPLPGIVRCRDGWVGINALDGAALHGRVRDDRARRVCGTSARARRRRPAARRVLCPARAVAARPRRRRDCRGEPGLPSPRRAGRRRAHAPRLRGVPGASVLCHRARRDDARPAVSAQRDTGGTTRSCARRRHDRRDTGRTGARPTSPGKRVTAIHRAARRRSRHVLGRPLLHDVPRRARRGRRQG